MNLQPAGWGVRIGAALIDLAIVTFVSWLFFIPVEKLAHLDRLKVFGDELQRKMQAGQMLDFEDIQPLFMGLVVVFAALFVLLMLMHAYYVYFESSTGQTPGKRVLNLRVISIDGSPLTKTQAVYREALRWYVDGLFIFPAFIAMAMTPRRQRVGDLAAKSMVVVVPKGSAPNPWP